MSRDALNELAAHIAEKQRDAVIGTAVSDHGELTVEITAAAVVDFI